MAEELKSEIRKLENLIGCEKADITSKDSIDQLIDALNSKYKSDIHKSIRCHRLEFYQALIEDARNKKKKSVEVEETFLLAKDAKDDAKEDASENTMDPEDLERPSEIVNVSPEDIDEWKNLMTLSKIYYMMEHPMSKGLTWERRVRKRKHIAKFTDKDLIEWRVSQNFRLKALEEWALSRSEARKLAAQSPYDFDDLLEDDESRQLEDMFNVLDSQKRGKKEVSALEKELHAKRPFKFKDETVEDWTDSYSDDSEHTGDEGGFCEILEIEEVPSEDFKIEEQKYQDTADEPSPEEEEYIATDMFSSYKEIPKYQRPIFQAMEETEDMTEWYDLCHDAIGEGQEFQTEPRLPPIKIAGPEHEIKPLNLDSGTNRLDETIGKKLQDGEHHESLTHEEDNEEPFHDKKDKERRNFDDEVNGKSGHAKEDNERRDHDVKDNERRDIIEEDNEIRALLEEDKERRVVEKEDNETDAHSEEDHKKLAHDDYSHKLIVDKDIVDHKKEAFDDQGTIQEASIKSGNEDVVQKAQSKLVAKIRPSTKFLEVQNKDIVTDSMKWNSKNEVNKEVVIEPDSIDKPSESNIGNSIKLILSKAKSSASHIAQENTSEKSTDQELGKPVEDSDSKRKIESISKDRINVEGKNVLSHKDIMIDKVKSIISIAKSSVENLAREALPSVSTDSLEYVLRKESVLKTKIDDYNAKYYS